MKIILYLDNKFIILVQSCSILLEMMSIISWRRLLLYKIIKNQEEYIKNILTVKKINRGFQMMQFVFAQ